MEKLVYLKPVVENEELIAIDPDGNQVEVRPALLKLAHEEGEVICLNTLTGRGKRLKGFPSEIEKRFKTITEQEPVLDLKVELSEDASFIHTKSVDLRPKDLVLSDIKWKYLVRSAMRGKNIMMVGPAGSGKTMAVKYLVDALKKPHFYFNLGSTQDPRSTLIGNTHFNKDTGTYFSESLFVKAIQTENAVILLDELTRAHPEAWNILMTVLDQNQRYLRLDEADNAPTIKVADGVSFIATANIGLEYTSTRTLDRALQDRFIIIEMDLLNQDQEYSLLESKYPNIDKELLKSITEITASTRSEVKSPGSKISSALSTRAAEEMASLGIDGFDLKEIAEVCIYPFFTDEGGVDSERTYIKQIVQKFIKDDSIDENLFNVESDSKEDNTVL